MTLAIIDADVLAYRAAAAVERSIDWDGDGQGVSVSEPKEAVKACNQILDLWLSHVAATDYRLLLSDKRAPQTSFRYLIHPKYKANRRETVKPSLLGHVVKYLIERKGATFFPGLEGDDAVGIVATDPETPKCVVVSTDKDMLTLPCNVFIVPHMRPLQFADTYSLLPMTADYNWFTQAITGDSVDNYLGAPGMGKQAAKNYLTTGMSIPELWRGLTDCYKDAWELPKFKRYREKWVNDSPYAEALMNVQTAHILRHGEYREDTQEVLLWHPKNPKWKKVF